MKKIFLAVLIVINISYAFAQEVGMHFEHNTTWEKVIEKAKQENKFIFVDCFTTWCGPCKTMSNEIFPTKNVGDFYNKNFVNVKIQMDVTKADNEDVKNWYATAKEIEKNYKINAYPTYLIFNADGQIVHRVVGSMDEESFIAKGTAALSPETQYYTLKNKYETEKTNATYLAKMLSAALDAYDDAFSKQVSKAYFATQKNLYTKDNLKLIEKTLESTNDDGFKAIAKSPAKVDEVLGKKGAANSIIKRVMMNEIVYPVLFSKTQKTINWNDLEKKIKAKAPSLTNELLLSAKIINAQKNKSWKEFSLLANNYMKTYSSTLNSNEINSLAWTIFEKCDDMACVAAALEYSKKSFADDNNPMYIDTYANLLHKIGKTAEAIVWETKAIDSIKEKGGDTADYVATLEKMKKGEKTW